MCSARILAMPSGWNHVSSCVSEMPWNRWMLSRHCLQLYSIGWLYGCCRLDQDCKHSSWSFHCCSIVLLLGSSYVVGWREVVSVGNRLRLVWVIWLLLVWTLDCRMLTCWNCCHHQYRSRPLYWLDTAAPLVVGCCWCWWCRPFYMEWSVVADVVGVVDLVVNFQLLLRFCCCCCMLSCMLLG